MRIIITIICAFTIGYVRAFPPRDEFYSHMYNEPVTEEHKGKNLYTYVNNVNLFLNFALSDLENHNITISISNKQQTSFNPHEKNDSGTNVHKENYGNNTPIETNISIQAKQNSDEKSDQVDNRFKLNNKNNYHEITLSNSDKNVSTAIEKGRQLHNEYNGKLNHSTANISHVEDTLLNKYVSNYTYNPNLRYLSTYLGISLVRTCTGKYERFSMPGSCDQYIECRNHTAELLQCMNGLHYNPEAKLNVSPCQYSFEVACQTENPGPSFASTPYCPHRFGRYKLQDKYNCSRYRICEFDVDYDYSCPDGLAFSSVTHRCDWPHNVPECDAEGYAGFRCPNDTDDVKMYSSSNCQVYFVCTNNVPRRMKCDEYLAFDTLSNTCIPADYVSSCPHEMKVSAAANRKKIFRDTAGGSESYLALRFSDLSFDLKDKPRIIQMT